MKRIKDSPNSTVWVSRILIVGTLLVGVPVAPCPAEPTPSPDGPPNVLLILVDDLGFSDLGCYGSEIDTPRIDALAASGLRFTQFYNTGRCWPTRASLLSGYYAQSIRRDKLHQMQLGGAGPARRPSWSVLLAEMLRPAGYRSYHTGKWHIDGSPTDAGFDRSFWSEKRYFTPSTSRDPSGSTPKIDPDDFYLTTAMADHAIEVLDEHQRHHGDQPFFEYLAFTAPHFPLHAKPEDIAQYQGRYDAGWDVIRRQRFHRMRQPHRLLGRSVAAPSRVETHLGPPYHFPDALPILGAGEVNRPLPWDQLTDQQKRFQAAKMEIHAAMVHRIDVEVGRVLDKIDEMGQTERTLVMFLSDNGGSAEMMVRGDGHDPDAPMGSAKSYLCLGPGWSTVANTPFRRHKTWTHEGGIATPMVVSWPARLDPDGATSDRVSHVIDVVPTLLELAGLDEPVDTNTLADGRPTGIGQPPGHSVPPKPGVSFADLLEPPSKSTQRAVPAKSAVGTERTLWWNHDGHRAIRIGDFKAVAPIGEPWELYDLSIDRGEQHDLAITQTERLDHLVSRWETVAKQIETIATADLSEAERRKAREPATKRSWLESAQQAGRPRRHQVLLGGETLRIKDRHAFVIEPESPTATADRPWVFYAPTLAGTPDIHERDLHQQVLDAGIAIAGIDVGESYGSPHAWKFFDALYAEMKSRGYHDQPVLLGRSRGGLWVSSWAIENPQRVRAIAGIYPVFDFTTYPGIDRAAPAYGLSPEALAERAGHQNPIARVEVLAKNQIPCFLIHGKEDQVVPLEPNSAALEAAYRRHGAGDHLTLVRIDGQGHNFWPGFFHCDEMIQFIIEQSQTAEPSSP